MWKHIVGKASGWEPLLLGFHGLSDLVEDNQTPLSECKGSEKGPVPWHGTVSCRLHIAAIPHKSWSTSNPVFC